MPAVPSSVLVVDDEPAVCGLIRDSLKSSGLRCVTVTEARQAKQLLDTQAFSVVVADIAMPGVSGLDLLGYAQMVLPDCKVILITGFPSSEHLARALSLGAYDYFTKPLDVGQLMEAIAQAASDGGAEGNNLPRRAANALQRESDFKQALLESVRALVHAVEAKDPYTRRHSEQVRHYALELAGFMGFAEDLRRWLGTASILHDIGKIGVPDGILTKPGQLTDEEFQLVRRHPVLGAEILSNISIFATEASLVRHHHENWDGSGYPDGLAGEQIPLGARVINVADSIDAMLMRRTYKDAYTADKMMGELSRCAGTQFDPGVAAAALQWCREHPDRLIRLRENDRMTA